ncbi:EAL domain-containing protein [Salinarimonas sp.]|uniref:sensor domain-containing phosphodiesterase n=1 Tax=Salinarimonas sp. TaxID=2766526 RepID=UPI0032D8FFFA
MNNGCHPDFCSRKSTVAQYHVEFARVGMNDTSRPDGPDANLPIDTEEATRLEALRALSLLGTPPSAGFDRIVETARDLFGAAAAYVSLIEGEREWRKALVGDVAREARRCDGFCRHTIRSDAVLVVEDALDDPRFASLPIVREGYRFYAGAPLVVDGARLGALAVLDRAPRGLGATDRTLLVELAKAVVDEIERGRGRDASTLQPSRFTPERRFQALAAVNACVVWRAAASGEITEAALSGPFAARATADLLGLAWLDLVHPADRRRLFRRGLGARRRGASFEETLRLSDGEGRWRWTQLRVVPLVREDGTLAEWIGKCMDVHERMLAEDAGRREAERLRLALAAGRMSTWEYDPETRAIVRDAASEAILGVPRDDLEAALERIHPEDRPFLDAAYAPGGPCCIDAVRYRHPDGRWMWLSTRAQEMRDADGRRRVVGVTFDITERKEAEERAWRAANRDSLTGLENRAAFQRSLARALSCARATAGRVSILLVDVDDFKDVNDAAGHDAGDALLREVAARLARVTGSGPHLARLGGDEFAVLIEGHAEVGESLGLAQAIEAGFRAPFMHGGRSLACRASIGVACFPDHADDAQELMMSADLALFSAKEQGRGRAAVYRPALRAAVEARVALVGEIRAALGGDAIEPHYQPKIDLATGAVTGFEALARWRHPVRGLITPGAFADAFENAEIALAIGERMARAVSADLAAWLGQGFDPGTVAINLSAAEFGRADLPDVLFAALDEAGVPRWRLGVEVTETVFLGKRAEAVAATLARFARAGMRIALDDFGTGYASLTHLKQFPVDDIKIDRSFVRDLERDPGDAAIVAAVIGLGRAFGLRVVAEGVETGGQEERLRGMGCDEGQGFRFGKPMPASRVPMFLREHGAASASAGAGRVLAVG